MAMYLPSVNELNKIALQQKVVEENDERVKKTVMKQGNYYNNIQSVGSGASGSPGYVQVGTGSARQLSNSRFSVNP
jgi:hypothetical protein